MCVYASARMSYYSPHKQPYKRQRRHHIQALAGSGATRHHSPICVPNLSSTS